MNRPFAPAGAENNEFVKGAFLMSNDPYTDGAVNSQPQQPDPSATREWNGSYASQQPDMSQGYAPQQPDMSQGYPPQQPQQPWNGGYPPRDPGMNQGYQQPPYQGGYQQPQQQAPYQNGYQQPPYQNSYQQPPHQGGYQQPLYQGGYQQPQPPRQPRAPRAQNPANSVVKLPRFIKKEKLPFLVKTLLCAFTGLMILLFINNVSLVNTAWYGIRGYSATQSTALMILSGLFAMGGAACLALGPILKKPLLAAIGCFVTAIGVMLAGIGYIVTRSFSLRWMDVLGGAFMILSSLALVAVGLNYLLKGRGVNAFVKRIACYAGFGCALLALILCAIPALSNLGSTGYSYSRLYGVMQKAKIMPVTGAITGSVLWVIFFALGLAAIACGLFLYNPEMQEFKAAPSKMSQGPIPMWLATGIAKILACVFAGCALLAFVFSIIVFRFIPFFPLLLWLAASVMMLLGTLLKRKCELFFAIGVFLAAAGAMVFMYGDSWYVAPFLFIQFLCLLGIGAHYLLKNRIVNEKQSALLTYISLGIGAAVCLFHIIMLIVDSNNARVSLDVLTLLLHIFILLTAVALFLAILFYKPFTAPRGYSPVGYRGGYPNAGPNGYPNGNGGNGAPY